MQENATDTRLEMAKQWAQRMLGTDRFELSAVSGDASFRRYFRIHRDGREPLILMDAPPEQENSRPFLDVARRLKEAGLHAPGIYHFDLTMGFGIIEDCGDELYRSVISDGSADRVFPQLLDLLAQMANRVSSTGLPLYDEALLQQELDLFTDWYLEKHKQRVLGDAERRIWNGLCATLIESALSQPQVFVHRDFHSCNLLHMPGQAPAIIDFQDAVEGPVSYDFISLAWDRYIHWPRESIEGWMEDMRLRLDTAIDRDDWIRYCDLMGLQRNLKVVGIFARLFHRDGKQGYVEMIPMFYRYLLDVLPRYPGFSAFNQLLEDSSCAP